MRIVNYMELFNEAGQFLSNQIVNIFEAVLERTPIKAQAIKLAQKHVAVKMQVALEAGVITAGSVKVNGTDLLIEMEYPATVTTTKGPNGEDLTINATQKVSKSYSILKVATKKEHMAILDRMLDNNSTKH